MTNLLERAGRWMIWVQLAVLAAVVAVAIVVFTADRGPGTYGPLDYPSPQELLNGDSFVAAPDTVIRVRGTKCNTSDEPVELEGVLSMERVDPPGLVVPVFTGTRTGVRALAPGCLTQTFDNMLPAEVIQSVQRFGPSGWRFTAVETPFRIDDREPIPETWTTETFLLRPE